MRSPFAYRAGTTLAALLAFAAGAAADTVDLAPSKDNTLIETPVGNSNGAGDGIYVGRVGVNGGGTRRRGVIAFDVSSLHAGATINTVTLTLQLVQSNDVTSRIVSMYRLGADWGEAGSTGSGQGALAQPGDATWLYRFFDTQPWASAGGDFEPVASASQLVGDIGSYQWTGPDLVADVQSWVDTPASNFGWLLKDNEATLTTARKYYSREGLVPPKLSIDFTPSPAGVGADPAAGQVVFAAPWPTPSRGRTDLSYSLPRRARVSLTIHDAMGRIVRRLVLGGTQPAGRYAATWDGRTDSGARAASGVYVASLVVDQQVHQRRIPLLR